ncbi:MAG: Zn-dependent hydrolase [Gemmatimonadota bacterium]|nr:Zn-dependent hydrolase [Gemmatimonadota bacterium]
MAGLRSALSLVAVTVLFAACGGGTGDAPGAAEVSSRAEASLEKYATLRLNPDLSSLSKDDQAAVQLLIEAAEAMNDAFWIESYGDRSAAERLAGSRAWELDAIRVNYGPWDRLANDEPFIGGVAAKPAGAGFYPTDMTKREFEAAAARDPRLRDPYTLVRRDTSGALSAIAYHQAFSVAVGAAAAKMREAAALSSHAGFARYLRLRATAIETDDYRASDEAWVALFDNPIDLILGPIDPAEDRLFGYKRAHLAYVVVRSTEWTERMSRFAGRLPDLQRALPVDSRYKAKAPVGGSDLAAWDVVFQAGLANAGAKHIAQDLPSDQGIRASRGSRRLQFLNSTRAKFEQIMVPISQALIDPTQREHVTFEAFFTNQMFHEVAHGLGAPAILADGRPMATAMGAASAPLEEGKADVLGLYAVSRLVQTGELSSRALDYQVTFLAGILRSVRFGGGSARARGGMLLFNHFRDRGAILREPATGMYRVDPDAMNRAVADIAGIILQLQATGAAQAAGALLAERGLVSTELGSDLGRLVALGIPHDIRFEQANHAQTMR